VSEPLLLDPILDLKAAAPLQSALLARRGQALEIDGSAVQRLGGLCLQVLISAHRTWGEDGAPLTFAQRSEAFDDALGRFGAHGRLDLQPLHHTDMK
jgi:chemotaxis protein CheX